jgi:hypothetical protein
MFCQTELAKTLRKIAQIEMNLPRKIRPDLSAKMRTSAVSPLFTGLFGG